MPISRTALAHGLTVGATVLTAAGAAVLAPSSDTIVPAAAAGLTALSGVLLLLKLTKAASVASELVPVLPTLVKLEATVEPLVEPLVAAEVAKLRVRQTVVQPPSKLNDEIDAFMPVAASIVHGPAVPPTETTR